MKKDQGREREKRRKKEEEEKQGSPKSRTSNKKSKGLVDSADTTGRAEGNTASSNDAGPAVAAVAAARLPVSVGAREVKLELDLAWLPSCLAY